MNIYSTVSMHLTWKSVSRLCNKFRAHWGIVNKIEIIWVRKLATYLSHYSWVRLVVLKKTTQNVGERNSLDDTGTFISFPNKREKEKGKGRKEGRKREKAENENRVERCALYLVNKPANWKGSFATRSLRIPNVSIMHCSYHRIRVMCCNPIHVAMKSYDPVDIFSCLCVWPYSLPLQWGLWCWQYCLHALLRCNKRQFLVRRSRVVGKHTVVNSSVYFSYGSQMWNSRQLSAFCSVHTDDLNNVAAYRMRWLLWLVNEYV